MFNDTDMTYYMNSCSNVFRWTS